MPSNPLRLVFDLMFCAAMWAVAVLLGMLGTLPSEVAPNDVLMRIGFSAAVAGLCCFVPIGATLWLLLTSSATEPAPAHRHDFDQATQLDLPPSPHSR